MLDLDIETSLEKIIVQGLQTIGLTMRNKCFPSVVINFPRRFMRAGIH